MVRRSGCMGRQVEQRLAEQLDAAEARGSLLRPSSKADAAALARRASRRPSPTVVAPLPGLYARRAYWDSLKPDARALARMRALAQTHPDWVFSVQSAALVHGFPVSYGVLGQTHIAAAHDMRCPDRSQVIRHEVTGDEPEVISGLRVTSFWRTVFDCLARLDFDEALVVADGTLRAKKISRRKMSELLTRRFRGCAGIRRVRMICQWAEPCAESGGESLARAAMIRLGFEVPHLQMELPDPVETGKRFRVDFVWRDVSRRLIFGEFDGKQKYVKQQLEKGETLSKVIDAEHERQTRLTVYRASFLRLSYAEVRDAEVLKRKLTLYGVPRGPAPRLRDGVPVPPQGSELRETLLGEGTIILDGQRIRYTQIAA